MRNVFLHLRQLMQVAPASHSDRKNPIIGLLQVAVIVGLVGAVVSFSRAPTADDVAGKSWRSAPAAAQPSPMVSVIRPETQTNNIIVSATGSVVVRSYVALTTQVSGRIEYLSPSLRDGGSFQAGQELLRLEPTDFRLALEQAQSDVASARATLLLQQAQSDAAKANYNILHPGKTVPTLVARKPQIEQAKAQLASAKAREEIARTELARTSFSLPFDGRVVSSSAEIGQVISRAQPFGEAFSLDAIEVAVPVSTSQLSELTPVKGRLASISSGDKRLLSNVERTSAELDQSTRFARVYLPVPDTSSFPPGTFVDVEISGPTLIETFVLPERAEQSENLAWYVRDGQLKAQALIKHGKTNNGIVVSSFDYGDGIVDGVVPGAYEGLAIRLPDRDVTSAIADARLNVNDALAAGGDE